MKKPAAAKSAKKQQEPDVLVLGGHASAHLVCALLAQAGLRVVVAPIADENDPDRLAMVNPALFELHPLLTALKAKLDLVPKFGLQFLADDGTTRSEHKGDAVAAYVGSTRQVRDGLAEAAKAAGAVRINAGSNPADIEVRALDERGIEIAIGGATLRPRLLILAAAVPAQFSRLLGLPDPWETEVIRRVTFVKFKCAKPPTRATVPMSLDLNGKLHWGWLLEGKTHSQLAVEMPSASNGATLDRKLLEHWVAVLKSHGLLADERAINLNDATTLEQPLAGALARDCVANRTLLIGPAGGFYSASAEDLYPNCWSALFAAETAIKALKETHLQDSLQSYRQQWGSTLGDYLRGPQQNLRFLLPLIYRNNTMTARLAESILHGQSVVR